MVAWPSLLSSPSFGWHWGREAAGTWCTCKDEEFVFSAHISLYCAECEVLRYHNIMFVSRVYYVIIEKGREYQTSKRHQALSAHIQCIVITLLLLVCMGSVAGIRVRDSWGHVWRFPYKMYNAKAPISWFIVSHQWLATAPYGQAGITIIPLLLVNCYTLYWQTMSTITICLPC